MAVHVYMKGIARSVVGIKVYSCTQVRLVDLPSEYGYPLSRMSFLFDSDVRTPLS